MPLLRLAYLLLPAREGLLHGLPLTVSALCAVLLVLLLWLVLSPRRAGWWQVLGLVSLCAVKLALAPLLVQHGLSARYYAAADCTGPSEDRIDTGFALKEHDFPLYFFNDIARFNFYRPEQPRRDLLPFCAVWTGYLRLPAPVKLYVRSANPVTVQVDGVPSVVPIGPGLHEIVIRYSNPYGAPRELEVGTVPGGPLQPEWLYTASGAAPTQAQLRRSRVAAAVLFCADLGYFGLILLPLLRASLRRSCGVVLGAATLAVAGLGLALLHPLRGRLVLLSGGDDWLTYESFARDILLHSPLMLMGAPMGHAAPFHYQVLYPYFLALAHLLLGEDLFGVLLLQTTGLFVCGAFLCLISRRLWGPGPGWATLLLWLVSLPLTGEYVLVSLRLLSEILAFVLFPLSALLFLVLMTQARAGCAVACGAVFGLTVLARSITLPAYPLLLLLVLLSWRRQRVARRRSLTLLSLMTLSFLLVAALPGLRNRVAAGTWRFLPQSGSYNLLLRNPIPPGVDLSRVDRPLYRALGAPAEARVVLEYARQRPVRFAAGLLGKAAFSLGLYRAGGVRAAFHPMSPVFAFLWFGLFFHLLVWRERGLRAEVAVLLAFAGVQILVMPVFAPTLQYGNRLALPMYLFLFPFGGHLLFRVVRLLPWPRPEAPKAPWRECRGTGRPG